jgi:hypothetical protein
MGYVTQRDLDEYGDAVAMAQRAAADVVAPVARQNLYLAQKLRDVQTSDIWSALRAAIPNADAINRSPEWIGWLQIPDTYSGVVKQRLLDQAVHDGDPVRVINLMKGFLREQQSGQQTAPARSTAARRSPNQAVQWTRQAVKNFYDRVRNGTIDEKTKDTLERQIIEAGRNGQIV